VTPPPDHQLPESPSSLRTDARLDATTRQKVDDLAQHFHRPRAAVLRQIMQWGLGRGQTGPLDQGESPGPWRHLYVYVPCELHERVQNTATTAGVKTAPWLRQMVRQITITDFPASWQDARPAERSHDSRTYGTRFMLRLDDPTQEKLEDLSTHFETSAAEIIRHLIAQATPEDFPRSWHMRAAEQRGPRAP
jgi:predicted DNA-binding protein